MAICFKMFLVRPTSLDVLDSHLFNRRPGSRSISQSAPVRAGFMLTNAADLLSRVAPFTKRHMKTTLLPILILVASLCGCAHQYILKLSNGTELTSPSKPRLKGANYHYKDAQGRDVVIPQSRVMQIQPASMAEEEKKFQQQKYSEPKRHWWQFWR